MFVGVTAEKLVGKSFYWGDRIYLKIHLIGENFVGKKF